MEEVTTVVASSNIATTLLSYGLFSTLAVAIVQFIKNKFKKYHPLVILGVISVVAGAIYAVLLGTGWWEVVYQHALVIGSAANLIYSVLDAVYKKTSKGAKTLSRKVA